MAKIYLKKVPDLDCKFDCYHCDLDGFKNDKLCKKMRPICTIQGKECIFKILSIVQKPIKSIKDLPKPKNIKPTKKNT